MSDTNAQGPKLVGGEGGVPCLARSASIFLLTWASMRRMSISACCRFFFMCSDRNRNVAAFFLQRGTEERADVRPLDGRSEGEKRVLSFLALSQRVEPKLGGG